MVEEQFIKLPGVSFASPCVDVTASGVTLMCRVDTGADITTLPIAMLRDFTDNRSDALVRRFDGTSVRKSTRSGWLWVGGKHIYLEKVLVIVGAGHGIIGMDVIKHFALLIVGSTVILE